jgi:hypothetical protein
MEAKDTLTKIKSILGLEPEQKTEETKVETKVELATPTPTPETETPAEADNEQKQFDDLKATVEDIQARLQKLEGMLMESQTKVESMSKENEKLSAIVEIIKNQPSDEPVKKTETTEDFKENKSKSKSKEEKYYQLGKTLGSLGINI